MPAKRKVVNGVRNARERAPGPGWSIPAAAIELKQSEAQLRADIKAGRIRAARVGGRDRIPDSALAARKAELE